MQPYWLSASSRDRLLALDGHERVAHVAFSPLGNRRTVVSAVLGVLSLAACGQAHLLECRDLSADPASFEDVRSRIVDIGAKSCSRCHNTTTPIYGYNFEGPGVTYDALTTRMEPIYESLVSGRMPKDGARWTEDDLRILRSWYCNGAFYDN